MSNLELYVYKFSQKSISLIPPLINFFDLCGFNFFYYYYYFGFSAVIPPTPLLFSKSHPAPNKQALVCSKA